MNIYEQEIITVLSRIANKVEHAQILSQEDLLELRQLVNLRTELLIQLRDQVIISDTVIKDLISELESADLTMEDMDDFIGSLRYKLESTR